MKQLVIYLFVVATTVCLGFPVIQGMLSYRAHSKDRQDRYTDKEQGEQLKKKIPQNVLDLKFPLWF